MALLLGLVPLLSGVPAGADEPAPDTTPPAIVFTPCGAPEVTACQKYRAVAYSSEDPGDLAVVGARIDDRVLDEFVYDDGSGPTPYGPLFQPGNDVVFIVEWAVQFVVPAGTNPVTFYARDLAGNTTEQVVTLTAATRPEPPRPTVRRGMPGLDVVGALFADANGGTIYGAEVVKRGTGVVRRLQFTPPRCRCVASYPKLRPGRHTFRVRARNEVGWSRWTTVSAVLPGPVRG